MNQTAHSESTATHQSIGHFLKQNLREYGMLLSLVAIMVFFRLLGGICGWFWGYGAGAEVECRYL